MKWVKRIVGFFISIQCVGLYSAAIGNMNRMANHMPNGGTGKSIYFAIIGTIFLSIGAFLIWSSFKTKNVSVQANPNINN